MKKKSAKDKQISKEQYSKIEYDGFGESQKEKALVNLIAKIIVDATFREVEQRDKNSSGFDSSQLSTKKPCKSRAKNG
jgi:hypothetical protein